MGSCGLYADLPGGEGAHLSEISESPAEGERIEIWADADAIMTAARAVTVPMRTIVPRTRGRSDAKSDGARQQGRVGVGRHG